MAKLGASKLHGVFWRQRLQQLYRPWLTAIGITIALVWLRSLGLLQTLELAALDQLLQMRSIDPPEPRIVLVTIDDADISQVGTWPLSDRVMATALSRLQAQQPSVIGLDLYRDLPVAPGTAELNRLLEQATAIVGIEKLSLDARQAVPPPPALAARQQVGFSNIMVDPDGQVRRSILFWSTPTGTRSSLALKLAQTYLSQRGIHSWAEGTDFWLGSVKIRPLRAQDGGYELIDVGGYQILVNPRSPAVPFDRISLSQVLSNQIPPNLLRDRVVLLGSTATSLRDFFYTSYSHRWLGSARPISGLELHAIEVSQLLGAVLDDRGLLQGFLPNPIEWLWTGLWTAIGVWLSWRLRITPRLLVYLLLSLLSLWGLGYVALLQGWWLPVVPPLLGLVAATLGVRLYFASVAEELKKSREFLNSIINTIPDPVFVKDRQHRWIMVNQAFCQLVGDSVEALLQQPGYYFLPPAQADKFWRRDNLTFVTGVAQEDEAELTDIRGTLYAISTKRSLHQDPQGKLFLVGVIRDMTQRQQMEQALRQTAAELAQANAELQQAQVNLTRLAYQDALTGLPNRKLFLDRLKQSLKRADQLEQWVAILFIDLDGFKQINDTYGHRMGDLLLQAVARRIAGCLRGSDMVARLGGDEFVAMLPSIPSLADTVKVADKILAVLSPRFMIEGKPVAISASIGISIYPVSSRSLDELLLQADQAMYDAKQLGKNRYCITQVVALSELAGD